MTLTEKEEYELRIKNMQSKIDWLRDQRKLMDTYGTRKPLTDEQVREIAKQYALGLAFPYESQTTPEMFARAIEAAHGIN